MKALTSLAQKIILVLSQGMLQNVKISQYAGFKVKLGHKSDTFEARIDKGKRVARLARF